MPRPPSLVATLLALGIALSACSTGSDGAEGPDGTAPPSGSGTQTPPTEPAEPTEPAAADEEVVMVGDHRHRPACQLFSPEDAVEVLRVTGETDFTQQAVTVSMREEDGPDPDAVNPSLARTTCSYSIGDAASTTVSLDVQEYADARTPRSRWTRILRFGEQALPPGLTDGPTSFQELDSALQAILEDAQESVGGVRVPGIDRRILWRTGSSEYIATVDNLLLTFDRGTSYGLTAGLSERDAALAERVLVPALERAADAETPTSLLPPLFSQADGWPPFLDPCSLLDAEAAEVLLGRPTVLARTTSVDLRPDVNLRADSPAGRSPENRCEREAEDGGGSAELVVQYVAPEDTADEVLESYLGNFAFGDPSPSRRQVDQIRRSRVPGGLSDVDASYVLVLGGEGRGYRSYLLLDRYVLELVGRLPKGRYGSRSVDTTALRDAGQLVAANLAADVADGTTD